MRPSRTRLVAASLLAAGLLLPSAALAAAYRSGENVEVPSGDVVTDDLYVSGGTVIIDGTVNGDVIAAGGEVRINGTVNGDLIVAGGTVEMRGTVTDDARIAGGELTVAGTVGDDLSAAGGTVKLAQGSVVGGDASLAGGDVSLAGVTGRTDIAGGTVSLAATAVVNGPLRYLSDSDITKADGATYGSIERRELPKQDAGSAALATVLAVLGNVLFAALLYLAFPKAIDAVLRPSSREAATRTAIGFGLLFALPIASLLLAISGIGSTAGFFLLLALPLFFYLGWLVGILIVGAWLFDKLRLDGRIAPPWGWAIAGGLVLAVLSAIIPVVGGFITMLALLLGTGSLLRTVKLGR